MVAELLQIWIDNDDDKDIQYSAEQYALLNDPDVITVLNQCKQYYEPKRHLTKNELTNILEDIARGSLTRKDYDFKNGEIVFLEPTFQERLTAIKMLREDVADDNTASTVQFVNNIIGGVTLQKPNLDAPDAPPPNHYSLTLDQEEGTNGT